MVDWKVETQLIEARGVDYIVYLATTMVPKEAATLFPEVTHQAAGQIDLIIGCPRNKQK